MADLTREQERLRDTDGVIARLAEEDTALKAAQDNDGDLRAEAALALQSVASALARRRKRPTRPVRGFRNSRRGAARLPAPSTSSGSALPGLNAMRARPAPSARPCSTQMGSTGDGPTLAAAVEAALAVLACQ